MTNDADENRERKLPASFYAAMEKWEARKKDTGWGLTEDELRASARARYPSKARAYANAGAGTHNTSAQRTN